MAMSPKLGFEAVSHQRKQVTRPLARGSRQAGTQCLDRSWRSLKDFLGPGMHVSKKVDGHRVLLPSVESLVFQWVWRQHVGTCSPSKFLQELEKLLKS